jgi:KDO2-lipid IV(A) lauroyltransferase
MPTSFKRLARRTTRALQPAVETVAGGAAAGLLKLIRRMDPDRTAKRAGSILKRIGPKLREHRIGRANLAAAFPEKSPEEIEQILTGVWDNLGRIAAEFAYLDQHWFDSIARLDESRIEFSERSLETFVRLRDDGKPALLFSAHLGNWELPALVAAAHKLETAMLYRRPSMPAVAEAVQNARALSMGRLIASGFDAPVKLVKELGRGTHVGMLVDQFDWRGVEVTFFGRRTKASPLLARLARHVDAPIHGVRSIRLPGHRFRVEITDEIAAPRDTEGKVDVEGTTQLITSVIERWVRENPEQWLWVHRRWREW